jgi:hypothetical protein
MTHKIKGRQKMRCLVHRRKKKIIIFLLIKLLHGEKEKKHCYSVVLTPPTPHKESSHTVGRLKSVQMRAHSLQLLAA